jgi:hypothetical protein
MFNLDNYETVEDRLIKFWSDHPNGRIATQMVHYDDNKVVFRAEIYFDRDKDQHPISTGYAEEIRGASPVNKTSHLENGETSAIGRGLANCGYATKGARPSREEMEKVMRDTPMPTSNLTEQVRTATQPRQQSRGPIQIKNPNEPASPAQVNKIRAELRQLGLPAEEYVQFVGNVLERTIDQIGEISKGEASKVIDQLMNG